MYDLDFITQFVSDLYLMPGINVNRMKVLLQTAKIPLELRRGGGGCCLLALWLFVLLEPCCLLRTVSMFSLRTNSLS